MTWLNYDSDTQRHRVRSSSGQCVVWGRPARVLPAKYRTADGREHTALLSVCGYVRLGVRVGHLWGRISAPRLVCADQVQWPRAALPLPARHRQPRALLRAGGLFACVAAHVFPVLDRLAPGPDRPHRPSVSAQVRARLDSILRTSAAQADPGGVVKGEGDESGTAALQTHVGLLANDSICQAGRFQIILKQICLYLFASMIILNIFNISTIPSRFLFIDILIFEGAHLWGQSLRHCLSSGSYDLG